MHLPLWTVAAIVFVWNVPFGYWRDHVNKYSLQWFLAIHLPVPVIIALRIFFGLGWHLSTFPVLMGSFFAGQLLGGRLHHLNSRHEGGPLSSCLLMDLFHRLSIPRNPTRRNEKLGQPDDRGQTD